MKISKAHREWMSLVDQMAPIKFEQHHRRHPAFNQWFQIAKGTRDPSYVARRHVQADGKVREYKPWDKYGAFEIIMEPRWYNFARFLKDNDHFIKNSALNPDSDPNRKLKRNLEPVYIDRVDRTKHFTPNNITFVTRGELKQDFKQAYQVETPFTSDEGKQLVLTLRELEAYLLRHKGEPYPEELGTYSVRMRVWDDNAGRNGKFVVKDIEVSEIVPVSRAVLQKRLQSGITDRRLYAPPQPRGAKRDEY